MKKRTSERVQQADEHTPSAPTDPLAGVSRKDMPALLAKAKAEGNQPLVDAILEACSK